MQPPGVAKKHLHLSLNLYAYRRHVLELSEGIENMGGIRWELFGCLALSWVLVFLCLIRGARSSGKVCI